MNANDVHRRWADRSSAYSPSYYAYYGPDGKSELVGDVLNSTVGPDARVLEPGCSSGRHLAHLHERGYDDLVGIDVNDDALEVMAESYPDLADAGTFHVDALENVVGEFDDGSFDAVFSVETLQHLPPDSEWVFAELARITDDLLVTVENEGEEGVHEGSERPVNYVDDEIPLYYRRWDRVFTDLGFVEVDSRSLERDTFRVFRRADR